MSRIPGCIAALIAVAMCAASVTAGERLDGLDVFEKGYPRAFFFRSTEGDASRGTYDFATWEERFLPLNGIMGKVLDEEVPGRSRGLPYFVEYKKRHPEKVVLLHLNGNGRDPRFDADKFFAGHWLYYTGCNLTRDLPAEEGTAIVHVEDTSLFKLNTGRYKNANEDLAICRLGPDGKPDWHYAEHLQLLDADPQKKTLTVRRGCFGTKPLEFKSGGAYIAAHATRGPWGAKSNWIWPYNHATTCPKDADGRTCNDVFLDEIEGWFAAGGRLAEFDGVEFDAAPFDKRPVRNTGRGLDVDADGVADNGYIDGINAFGIGIHEFFGRLRARLGDDRLMLVDVNSGRSPRSVRVFNGIESEGWPHLSDFEVERWSESINRHFFWRQHARPPVFNYINHKFMKEGKSFTGVAPNISRLVLAVAMCTDSAVTYALAPPGDRTGGFPVWDELCLGEEKRSNWLGEPRGETIRLGRKAPDMLKGGGVAVTEEFVSKWTSDTARVKKAKGGRAIIVESITAGKDTATMTVTLPGIRVPEGDLLVYCNIWCDPMTGYPPDIPRLVEVDLADVGWLMDPSLPAASMCIRGRDEEPLRNEDAGAKLTYVGKRSVGGETHDAYAIHPPYGNREGPGYIVWEKEVAVPESPARLKFYTGLSESAGKSDGIEYSVVVRTHRGEKKVFEHLHKSMRWKTHEVNLDEWAGDDVTLRFLADSGPDDSSTADHGLWGDVRLEMGSTESVDRPGTFTRQNTFVSGEPFLAEFYFRDAGAATVDLAFRIEGNEPVYISDFTIHNAADAMAREFENGAVIVNPSMHPYTFDLAKTFPSASFQNIQGTKKQDPETNNGRPTTKQITIGSRDGLFLVKR
jgi:hypothetical protein